MRGLSQEIRAGFNLYLTGSYNFNFQIKQFLKESKEGKKVKDNGGKDGSDSSDEDAEKKKMQVSICPEHLFLFIN